MTRTCRSRISRAFAAIALLLALFALPAAAQTTAALTGPVTDENGNPFASATVTISSPALQGSRSTLTGASGAYQFSALPPGDYTVDVTREGLKAITQHIELHLSQTSRADATLYPPAADILIVVGHVHSVLETAPVGTTP